MNSRLRQRYTGLLAFAAAQTGLVCTPLLSQAQEILEPPPPGFVPTLPFNPAFAPEQPAVDVTTEALLRTQRGLEWALQHFSPRANYRFSYGKGVQGAGDNGDTYLQEITTGLTVPLGDKWAIDYTPSLRYYSDPDVQDGLDHFVRFSGGTTFRDWSFGLAQSYLNTSTAIVETGQQTEREIYDTSLSAVYDINSALALDLGASQSFRSATDFVDSKTWSTMDWLVYRVSPSLNAGVGVGGGYTDVSEEGSDMTFELLQARVGVSAGPKLSLSVNGGADFRQFLASGASDVVNPIYGLSGSYQLFRNTSLGLLRHVL
jgi:hypothetical protein